MDNGEAERTSERMVNDADGTPTKNPLNFDVGKCMVHDDGIMIHILVLE